MKKKIAVFCVVLFVNVFVGGHRLMAMSSYWDGILGSMQNASVDALQKEFVQSLQGKASERLGYDADEFRDRAWKNFSVEELIQIVERLQQFCQKFDLINTPLLRLYQAAEQLCRQSVVFARICEQAGLSFE